MTKILILNDIHAGKSRESTSHPGLVRQANSQAIEKLSSYISKFNSEKYDFIINLGDLIRDEDKENDLINLSNTLEVISKLVGRKIILAGNHEYKLLSINEVDNVLSKYDLLNDKNGIIQIDNTKYIWIDSLIGDKDLASISSSTLSWLDEQIKDDDIVILFSHYSVAPLDGKDNFYFANDFRYMSYTNADQVLKILNRCAKAVTINAHTHMGTYKRNGNVQSISAMSFTENIVAGEYPEANPGVYSILSIDGDKMMFKSYGDDFCFLSLEL